MKDAPLNELDIAVLALVKTGIIEHVNNKGFIAFVDTATDKNIFCCRDDQEGREPKSRKPSWFTRRPTGGIHKGDQIIYVTCSRGYKALWVGDKGKCPYSQKYLAVKADSYSKR